MSLLYAASGPGGRELIDLQRRIATPLPLRRRIGVASLAGGAGCSTVAAELGIALAARRPGAVLCVDAQGISPTPLAELGEGIGFDSLGWSNWPAAVAAWWRRLGRRQRDYDLTITDWGATPLERMADVAAHSHALCLVAPAERTAVQRALDLAAVVGERTAVAIAVNDVHGTAGLATAELVRRLPATAALLRYDRRRPAGIGVPRPLRGGQTLQILRLTAALVDAAGASGRGTGASA